MGVILVARHASKGTQRVLLGEDGARFADIPARFVLRDGSVAAQADPGATVVQRHACITVDHWTVVALVEPDTFIPRDGQEKELFQALAKEPAADDVRAVYGDWLEEHGHTREADVLALERQLRTPVRNVQDLARSLRAAAAPLPLAWRVVATRPRIHCGNGNPCPRSWEKLAVTDDALVRRCESCSAKVVFAPTRELARVYADLEWRVALDVAVAEAPVGRLTHEGPLTSLPFFTDERPATMREVLASFELLPPDELRPRFGGWRFFYPDASSSVVTIDFDYPLSPLRPQYDARYSTLENLRYRRLRIRLRAPRAEIERWLEERHGPSREAIEPPSPRGASTATPHRIYGQWLLADDSGGIAFSNGWTSSRNGRSRPRTRRPRSTISDGSESSSTAGLAARSTG